MADKKIFLLDAYALIYRAYYAFIRNPRVNSKGENTSAIFGFVNTLDDLLKKENPTHIGVVFDPPGPTFRHDMFEEYKAHREATPEDIKLAVPYIKQIIEAYQIPIVEVAGYEADDVIGTLSVLAEKDGFDVFMMTPDKDYAQLVTEKVKMYRPARSGNPAEVLGIEEVKEKFGVDNPLQVIDILGLQGDAADNIPGCPGVGEKTAVKLIGLYKSIEGLYENVDQLKGKQKEKVIDNKELVFLSKVLATIKLDVPTTFEADQYLRKDVDIQRLTNLFNELEFRTLLKRHSGEAVVAKPATQGQLSFFDAVDEDVTEINTPREILENRKHQYFLVENAQQRASLRAELSVQKAFVIDTLTEGRDALSSDIIGLSFSWKEGEAYYLPLPDSRQEIEPILKEFKHVFEDENIVKVGHDIKHHMLVLNAYGQAIKGKVFDTMIAHYLLQPDQKHELDVLAENQLNYILIDNESFQGKKGKKQLLLRTIEAAVLKDYASERAETSFRLMNLFEKALHKEKLDGLFYDMEMPLLKVLTVMENYGITLNIDGLQAFSKELVVQIDTLEKDILDLAGEPFNVSSPKQVGDVLFGTLKLDEKAKKTKSGQYSTSEDVLQKLAGKHPIIDKILEYRGLKKLLSTYVDALPELINERTGKIHTSFNQAVAATGRLSSNNPNLQNIPIRDAAGREIRRCFTPSSDEYTFFSADYSQVELRLMAHMSNDENMKEAFLNGEDIHASTAAKINHLPLEEVDSEQRRRAKTANFGIIYGISAFGLAERLNISRAEGKSLITGYFESYPHVKAFMDECISSAREKGYVETLLGRKRHLADINSRNGIVRGVAERNAINAPIQGSAADIIKIAMINIFNKMQQRGMKSEMVLQVHDELNFNAYKPELEELKELVIQEMEGAIQLSVPLTVECGSGNNWLEAH